MLPDEKPPEGPPKTRWGWFVLLVAVALGGFELGWKISRSGLEDELQQLQRSKEWKLPENLAALGDLSRRVSLQMQERDELLKNRERVTALTVEAQELHAKVESLSDANAKLAAEAAACTPEVLTIEVGEAKQFAPGWSVGVKRTDTSKSEAVVQTGQNLHTLGPGNSVTYVINGSKYTITLAKIEMFSCKFEISRYKP
jgi:predicted RNase H-like nuclease (RuvC/YqgF family)